MKRQVLPRMINHLSVLAFFMVIWSCRPGNSSLDQAAAKAVNDSVGRFMAVISGDISKNGPVAWLNYFEDTPGFFMADDGMLVFKNYPSAKLFIKNTLVKSITHIKLNWSDTHIDPLSANLAAIGSDFHESLTYAAGNIQSVDGYFTATAQYAGQKWQLRNAHWSMKPPVASK